MKFRLLYDGPLRSGNKASRKHKHEIRKAFSPQLQRLWDIDPFLSNHKTKAALESGWFLASENHTVAGIQFVPVVRHNFYAYCQLDILFLRPDSPGSLLQSGDIDNRLKTLIDALRMPSVEQEVPRDISANTEKSSLFVLLEDDSMVTKLSVETDTLLQPAILDTTQYHVQLVITVTVTPYMATWSNIGL